MSWTSAPPTLWARVLVLAFPLAFMPMAAIGGDPETGGELAMRWCSSCHLVDTEQEGTSDIAPPFVQVANDPDTTDDGLQKWLANPHPPMPNFNLGQYEIDHLIAYILSLKSE